MYYKKNLKIFLCFLLILFSHSIYPTDSIVDAGGLKKLYLEGKFQEIQKKFENIKITDSLPDEALNIYIEALIRSGESEKAGKLLNGRIKENGSKPEFLVLRSMLLLANGDIVASTDIVDSLISQGKIFSGVILQKFNVELYHRNFHEAERWLNRLSVDNSGFGKSGLFQMIAMDFYRSVSDFNRLGDIYYEKMKGVKKKSNRDYYENLKLNYKLYKRKSAGVFNINLRKDLVEIPFDLKKNGRLKSIVLETRKKKYDILLDTGNTSGWLIHSRDLRDDLNTAMGGRTILKIGTESESLDGFSIFSRTLVFENIEISGLFGNYIPKPRQDFFDANLNPTMLSNGIVSLDFIRNKLIVRSKERFFSDIKNLSDVEVMRIPWYGYRYPMVPVIVNGHNGLALIETGAEDISANKEFADNLGIELSEKSKYLSNGKVFKYSTGSLNVQLGKYVFVRKQAEIWPLERFRNRLTGFTPGVILGPEAFENKFIISFVPDEKVIVFIYEKKK